MGVIDKFLEVDSNYIGETFVVSERDAEVFKEINELPFVINNNIYEYSSAITDENKFVKWQRCVGRLKSLLSINDFKVSRRKANNLVVVKIPKNFRNQMLAYLMLKVIVEA